MTKVVTSMSKEGNGIKFLTDIISFNFVFFPF